MYELKISSSMYFLVNVISFLLTAEYSFSLCMCCIFFNCTSGDGPPDCFHIFGLVNSTLSYTLMCVSVSIVLESSGYIPMEQFRYKKIKSPYFP